MKASIFFLILLLIITELCPSYAENIEDMKKIYSDESHCLVGPEIRGKYDKPVSCFCRDAIVDARYVYQNYLLTERDKNLNGVFLTLWDHAQQVCGENYDILKATETKEWQWTGPEITREYPSGKEIQKIKPDGNGFREVQYKVRLIYKDAGGGVLKADNFTAIDRFPPDSWTRPTSSKMKTIQK